MAILASRTRTGISWIGESIALFKQSPRKWMLLALVYLGLLFLPSMPGLQLLAFFVILIWPIFIVIAMRMLRNVEVNQEEDLSAIMQLIQPKMKVLITLGLINLIYIIVVGMLLSADMKVFADIAENQNKLNEQEMVAAMLPIFFKLFLMCIPLVVAGWFAPMLIAFNGYSLVKAIKSSIAGVLQYIVAMVAAWLLLNVASMTLMIAAIVILGVFAFIAPTIGQPMMNVVMFGGLLVNIALTLAFQYVSYRDVFRGAPSI